VPSNLSSKPNRDRSATVVIPLLLLQLALLSFQIQNPSGMTPIRTMVLAVQAPIVGVTSGISSGLRGAWARYVWLVGARRENEQLRESVRRLAQLNRSYEEIRQENNRLRRLLSVRGVAEFRSVGARVIARTPGFLSNVIYIDCGYADGVRIDCPVVSGDGIIGRIVLVSGNQSQVQLITNPDASTGVLIEETRTPGVLRGTGDRLMDLHYISNEERVRVDDVILSSGLDAVFPKGYLIGKVVDSRKSEGVFYHIKVEPTVDLYHIEEVSVLLMGP